MLEVKLNEMYQSIALNVIEMILEKWEKIYFFGEILDNRIYYYFYYRDFKGEIKNIDFLIGTLGLDESVWNQQSSAIWDDLTSLRNIFCEFHQEPWDAFYFDLSFTGEIEVHFEYNLTTHSVSSFYRSRWEYQKLGITQGFQDLTELEKKEILDEAVLKG